MSWPVILGFAGSASRPSRTRGLVDTIGAAIVRRTGGTFRSVDLTDIHPSLGATLDPREAPPDLLALLGAIAEADALVVGSPVYKGTYTGLFKHLFDLIDPRVLKDKPVLLTATGGSERHALVLDHGLRPLFAFFSADIVATGIYATEADFIDHLPASASVTSRIDRAATELSWRLAARADLGTTPVAALAAS